MKILIVEDDKDLIQSISEYLSNAGMQCDEAMTLRDALSKVNENRYNVVVLDIGLPDGSGLQVIEELNKKEY